MWCEDQQRLCYYILKLIRENRLSKMSVVASEIGMTESEFSQKISLSPRIPLSDGEYVKITGFIMDKSPEMFESYLQEKFRNMNIVVKQ